MDFSVKQYFLIVLVIKKVVGNVLHNLVKAFNEWIWWLYRNSTIRQMWQIQLSIPSFIKIASVVSVKFQYNGILSSTVVITIRPMLYTPIFNQIVELFLETFQRTQCTGKLCNGAYL